MLARVMRARGRIPLCLAALQLAACGDVDMAPVEAYQAAYDAYVARRCECESGGVRALEAPCLDQLLWSRARLGACFDDAFRRHADRDAEYFYCLADASHERRACYGEDACLDAEACEEAARELCRDIPISDAFLADIDDCYVGYDWHARFEPPMP